jgi:hypothetical protein
MPKHKPDDDVMGLFADEPEALPPKHKAPRYPLSVLDEPEEESDLGRFADFILDPARVRASVEARKDYFTDPNYTAQMFLESVGNGDFPQSWNELKGLLVGAISLHHFSGPTNEKYDAELLEGLFIRYGAAWMRAHLGHLAHKYPTLNKG